MLEKLDLSSYHSNIILNPKCPLKCPNLTLRPKWAPITFFVVCVELIDQKELEEFLEQEWVFVLCFLILDDMELGWGGSLILGNKKQSYKLRSMSWLIPVSSSITLIMAKLMAGWKKWAFHSVSYPSIVRIPFLPLDSKSELDANTRCIQGGISTKFSK